MFWFVLFLVAVAGGFLIWATHRTNRNDDERMRAFDARDAE